LLRAPVTSRSVSMMAMALLIAVGSACGSNAPAEDPPAGADSGALCPSKSTATYDNFGKAFFDTYCQGCHASALTGDARMGAPTDHTFDTLAQIRSAKSHIDQTAASGPKATNTFMPEGGAPKPTMAERQTLGEWLACGAP